MNAMINRHEMSPSARSNNFTNINFCHREPLTPIDLPVLMLKFPFASASWHQKQTKNKRTLTTGTPAKMSLQNALSEGNHKGHKHGTAQREHVNIKPGINQSHVPFPQFHNFSFGIRSR